MRKAIVAEAHRWLEVPYKLGGSSREGIDCSHLARKCLQAAGLKIVAWCDWLFLNMPVIRPLKLLEPGDLAFFNLKEGRTPGRLIRHVGIDIGNQRMIHACSRAGRVIKSSYNSSDLEHLVAVEERTEVMIQQWLKEIIQPPP